MLNMNSFDDCTDTMGETSKLVQSDTVLYVKSLQPHLTSNYETFRAEPHDQRGTGKTQIQTAPLVLKCCVVVACLLLILLSMGFGYSLSILYAQLIRVFDTDRSLMALNQSFYEALLAVGGALWSYPVSKLGYGPCVIIGAIAGCVCIGLSSIATNIPTIIVLVGILSGGAFGILYMAPFVVAGDVFGKNKKAVIGFVSIGSSLGQFTMSFLMEYCIEEYTWSGAMFILSAACLNAIPCGMLLIILQTYTAKNQDDKDTASAKRSLFQPKLFKEKLFWVLMVNSVSLAFTALAESRFLVDIAELKGFGRQRGSLLIAIVGVSNLIGGLIGALSKVTCKLSSSAHMAYWLVIIIIPHAMVVYGDSYLEFIVVAIINGVCIGNIYAHVAVAMYEIYGTENYAPSFAAWNISKGVGNFLGGFLGGTIQDTTGSYDLLFRLSIILSLSYALSFSGICLYRHRTQPSYTKLDNPNVTAHEH